MSKMVEIKEKELELAKKELELAKGKAKVNELRRAELEEKQNEVNAKQTELNSKREELKKVKAELKAAKKAEREKNKKKVGLVTVALITAGAIGITAFVTSLLNKNKFGIPEQSPYSNSRALFDDNDYSLAPSYDHAVLRLKDQLSGVIDLSDEDLYNYVKALNGDTLDDGYNVEKIADIANVISSYNMVPAVNSYYGMNETIGSNIEIQDLIINDEQKSAFFGRYTSLRNNLINAIKEEKSEEEIRDAAEEMYAYIINAAVLEKTVNTTAGVYDVNTLDADYAGLIFHDLIGSDLTLLRCVLGDIVAQIPTSEGTSPLTFDEAENKLLQDYTDAYENIADCESVKTLG